MLKKPAGATADVAVRPQYYKDKPSQMLSIALPASTGAAAGTAATAAAGNYRRGRDRGHLCTAGDGTADGKLVMGLAARDGAAREYTVLGAQDDAGGTHKGRGAARAVGGIEQGYYHVARSIGQGDARAVGIGVIAVDDNVLLAHARCRRRYAAAHAEDRPAGDGERILVTVKGLLGLICSACNDYTAGDGEGTVAVDSVIARGDATYHSSIDLDMRRSIDAVVHCRDVYIAAVDGENTLAFEALAAVLRGH